MNKITMSWPDRLAVINHFNPSDEQVCKVFNISMNELSTARHLQSAGTFIPTKLMDFSKYSSLFLPSSDDKISLLSIPTTKVGTTTVHVKPETASKRVKVPQKRGRKGDKITKALLSVPNTQVSIETFMKQHGVSLAVLRQSKRFTIKLDTDTQQRIGKICVRQDKTTKQLMIWRDSK